jgi:hypothetical protein
LWMPLSCLLVLFTSPLETGAQPVLSLHSMQLQVGDEFEIPLLAQDIEQVSHFLLVFSYDPALEITEIQSGNGLLSRFSTFRYSIVVPGMLAVVGARWGSEGIDSGPIQGTGVFFTIKGRAGLPHNGSSTIHLLYNYGDLDGVIYLPGQVVVYSDLPRTPTPTPVKNNTPTTVLSPTATPLPPQGNFVELVYSNDFSQNDLPSCGLLHIPGGYSGALSGTVQTNPFQPALFPNSADHKGLSITVRPGELVFVCTSTPIDTRGFPLMLQAHVHAEHADADIALAALKGNILSGELMDGSIASHVPASLTAFVHQVRRLVLFYEPDTGNLITPVIQVSSRSTTNTVVVHIDRLDIYQLNNPIFRASPE